MSVELTEKTIQLLYIDNQNTKLISQVLFLLSSMAKQTPKLIQPFWKDLFQIFNLPKHIDIRINSYKLVLQLVSNSEKYLQMCNHSSKQSSFTSLSQLLSDQISSLFDFLISEIGLETNEKVLTFLWMVMFY